MATGERRRNNWKRPPANSIKCNYDGSYRANVNVADVGWLFRDSEGVFRGAGSISINLTHASLEGEFKALIIAMQSA